MRVVGPLAVSAVTPGIAREAFAQNTDLDIYTLGDRALRAGVALTASHICSEMKVMR